MVVEEDEEVIQRDLIVVIEEDEEVVQRDLGNTVIMPLPAPRGHFTENTNIVYLKKKSVMCSQNYRVYSLQFLPSATNCHIIPYRQPVSACSWNTRQT